MRENQGVLINNIVGVSILGNEGTFVCYTSDLVSIEKTNVKRINERIKDKTNPFHAFVNEFEERTFKIDGSKKMQLTIADMGFIYISDKMTLKLFIQKQCTSVSWSAIQMIHVTLQDVEEKLKTIRSV